MKFKVNAFSRGTCRYLDQTVNLVLVDYTRTFVNSDEHRTHSVDENGYRVEVTDPSGELLLLREYEESALREEFIRTILSDVSVTRENPREIPDSYLYPGTPLLGLPVTSVVFVEDYAQLVLDDSRLTMFVIPTVLTDTLPSSRAENLSRLCDTIRSTIVSVDETLDRGLEIALSNGSTLLIGKRELQGVDPSVMDVAVFETKDLWYLWDRYEVPWSDSPPDSQVASN